MASSTTPPRPNTPFQKPNPANPNPATEEVLNAVSITSSVYNCSQGHSGPRPAQPEHATDHNLTASDSSAAMYAEDTSSIRDPETGENTHGYTASKDSLTIEREVGGAAVDEMYLINEQEKRVRRQELGIVLFVLFMLFAGLYAMVGVLVGRGR